MSVAFGILLGLESETREEKKKVIDEKSKLGGIRTYSILSLFGAVTGLLYANNAEVLSYMMFIVVFGLIVCAYVLNVRLKSAFGLTTEIAILITFILGFLTTSEIISDVLIVFLFIILLFFLSSKSSITSFSKKFKHFEIIDLAKFGIVSVIILPFLPNRVFSVGDIGGLFNLDPASIINLSGIVLINPYQVWSSVILISGFSLVGSILGKFLGRHNGSAIIGFFSGFVSSTSATISFANRTKSSPDSVYESIAASLFSKSSSFIVLASLLLVSSSKLFESVYLFLLILFVLTFAVAVFFYRLSSTKDDKHDVKSNPFSILPAVKLVSIILILTVSIQFLQSFDVNENLLILITSISGMVGIDAPSISIGGLVENGSLGIDIAVLGLLQDRPFTN